jgi:FHS family L-fucose permease-like MFS transporter
MAIVGGAIVPVIGGVVADATSLAMALMVPVFCYGVIAAFGWLARRAAEPLPEISGEAPSIL